MLKHWLLAVRPKTLTIAVVPVLVGTTLGWIDGGRLNWGVAGAALLVALLIQAGTNLHNDAADFARGADDPGTRLGPPRATAQGWLRAEQVRRGALACFGLALATGGYLVWSGGWPILVVGLLSILAGLAYTGGPRPIAYTGLGEAFVWVFFGVVAVAGSYYLQTAGLNRDALLAGTIIGMPAAAVLVVNNYRDLDNDRLAGRRTLAVRFGRRASQVEYGLLMLLPFALLLGLGGPGGLGWNALLPYLALPWAVVLVRRFRKEAPGPAFNTLLAGTARFQLAFSLLLCLGLLHEQGLLGGA